MTHPQEPEQQGPPHVPPRRSRRMPTWAIVLLSVAGGLVLLCGGGTVVAVVVAADQPATSAQPTTEEEEPNSEPAADPVDDPEPEPEPEPSDPVLPIGTPITVEERGAELGTITVTDVEVTTSPVDSFGRGPDHGHFVLFTVELEAVASMDVFGADFYIVHDDGERVDEGNGNAWDAVDHDDQLGFAELDAGQHRSGVLAFDLAELEGELAYAPNFEGGPIVSWQLDES